MRRVLFIGWAVLLLGTGCRSERKRSIDYAQAIELHATLVGSEVDEAYSDPQMEEVVGLLRKVNESHVEHGAALSLLDRIQKERERVVAERKAREDALKKAQTPVPFQHSGASASPAAGRTEVAAPSPRAGDQPEIGMGFRDFDRQFSGCFTQWQSIEVKGRGPMDAYELKDITNCRERHPGFMGKLVLVRGSEIYSFIERSAVRLERRLPDGGVLKNAGSEKP